MAGPGSHPNQMNFPKLDSTFLNPDGTVAQPWYRLLTQFFRLSGASNISLSNGVYLIQSEPRKIDAYSAMDNEYIETLSGSNIPGPAPVPVAPDAPGFEFSADIDGVLQVFGAKVEVRRSAGGGGWFPVSLVGGSFPLLVGDSARLSWTGADAPAVEFWGSA